jgi:glycine/D-amino acid oxidase-like deaminating enzyme
MRIAIVGGGIAGAALAWRLTQGTGAAVEVFLGDRPMHADASGASGGLVRGFETDAQACRLAAESLAEVRGSESLREWSGYREVGSAYLTGPDVDPTGSLAIVEELLPGSAVVASAVDLADRFGFRGLPGDTIGIVERHAGYLSPARLRGALLAQAGAVLHRVEVAGVTRAPAVRLADGVEVGYDAVVVAAGGWTPRLLAGGAHPGTLRTKQIQYSVYPVRVPGLGAFVDETSGLYGRPTENGSFLLGLPSHAWDVEPTAVVPDKALAEQVTACARRRLDAPLGDSSAIRTVASFDCYHDPAGLALRATEPGSALFTFTGGSGGAAKTVLAASRIAAGALLAVPIPT